MPNRLLEIGASWSPAIQNPGSIFATEPDIDYFAIDAGRISNMIARDRLGIFPGVQPQHEYYHTACLGVMSALPYKSEQFRRVIMKSVIGEYSLALLDKQRGPDAKGIRSSQTCSKTVQGFPEVFRVLEPGGHLIISEEDTPANSSHLTAQLSEIGFTGIAITPYNKLWFRPNFDHYCSNSHLSENRFAHSDREWRELRGAFWSLDDKYDKYGQPTMWGRVDGVAERYYPHSYILTASKPAEISR